MNSTKSVRSRPPTAITDETDHTTTKNNKVLGILNKRYFKSVHGILHGILSLKALVLGNLVFADRVLLGTEFTKGTMIEALFHRSNFLSSFITLVFFWNHVQNWRLGSSTMEERELTPQILKRFNQGRGVVTMLLFSLFPLVCTYGSQAMLDSQLVATSMAVTFLVGSAGVYRLVKDYSRVMWMVYGLTPMMLGLSLLTHDGSIASFLATYPSAMDWYQKEASFVVSCVQMGFLLYYLYSRNKVTQTTVNTICKTYHVGLTLVYLFRVEHDLWVEWNYFPNAAATAVTTVPGPMVAKVMLLTLALSAKIVPLVFGKLLVVTVSKIESLLHENLTSSWSIEGIQSHAAQPHPTARASTAVAKIATTCAIVTVGTTEATTQRRRQRRSVTERILA
mmetsp:Transcript_1897/g.2134  ORF Transcript_1897/g.2134 Transcript_1897/m.2134 type:complete len:393 (+) Transcript_1897:152-1330(+)|eukprot:CAMPEP_0170900528 /NCGR_PEP_ID=MMETSP0734-20130129/47654_1 /TAXON_ID=186038 /ORGANISM="Fragilariopsis kerguelensis, Strain L26-C5" /LENGTH=392 /DNA_ID=CAMNT_0011294399 /DNA_START=81 /DNA_END=1259 /DNA_ORIENTATION=-